MAANLPVYHPKPLALTATQRKVARLMLSRAMGKYKIAQELHISPDCAKNHLTAIFNRTGTSTTLEATICILHSEALLTEIYGG